ncbi:MAG: hypothetical protein IKU98_07920, partial [Bacteroidaceae bacterium]|nr:hypothetical protein [Bacteroidaceae bacterium]
MKQTKRFLGLITTALLTSNAWAQMVFTYSSVAKESTLADGSTFVRLLSDTDLNGGFIIGATVAGQSVPLSDITPNPATTFITDGEIETFVYDGKAYSFRFTATQWFTVVVFADPEINMSGEDRADNVSTNETMTK